jgi:hypothetical protein
MAFRSEQSVTVAARSSGPSRWLSSTWIGQRCAAAVRLGAYQGAVYEAVAEAGLHPEWTAGISIGAINAAIIAGESAGGAGW